MAQAIVAGLEARRLQPDAYYVHLGLARAFSSSSDRRCNQQRE